MPDISNLQPNFHGGEWSPFTQGRMDRPDYRSGMLTCLNTIPLEEGAATRRPGFRRLGFTRGGGYAAMREFHFNVSEPYVIELTHLHLRLWGGSPLGLNSSNLIVENGLRGVASISADTPAEVETTAAHGFSTGDTVMFRQTDGLTDPGTARLLNRQFLVTVTGSTAFTIADAVTGAAFDGSSVTLTSLFVARVYDQVTPWTAAEVASVRTVQDNKTVALFQANHKPRRMIATVLPTTCENAEFSFSTGDLLDGPYFDPYDNAPTATADGLSGVVEVTLGSTAYPFVATDVGRAIRLFSEPPEWDVGTNYAAGDSVRKFDDYYTALEGSTGADPFSSPAQWLANPAAARWSWGTIQAVTDATHADVNLSSASDLLYTTPMRTWRMGLYSDTTGWPTGGVFHEGRLWIWGNVIPNRIDGSKSNEGFAYDSIGVFSPTGWDGTVADNNGVAAVFRADQTNPIFWAISDDQGLLCGTKAGEWLIRAGGGADDAITPTSIRAKRITRYGSSDVQPTRVGDAIMFVNRFNRKLYEYMADASASSPRYSASNLTLKAKHLTATGIAEVVYQQELCPLLWVRTLAGALIGCTYKKDGEYSGIREDIQGWHQHTHGDAGRTFEAIQAGPTGQGLDTLYAVTFDPTTGYRQVEQLQLIFGQNAEPATGNFLDASVVPTAAEIEGSAVRYYGLDHMNGETVSAWIAGLDMGEFTVADGSVLVPFNDSFNLAKLAEVTTGSTYFGLALDIASGGSPTPPVPNLTLATTMVPGGETITAPGSTGPVIMPAAQKLYTVQGGNNDDESGYRRYNPQTGVLEASLTRGQFVDGGGPEIFVGGLGVAESGAIYTQGGSANYEAIYKINPDFTPYAGRWGDTGGFSGGIMNAAELVAVTVGGVDFFAGVSFAFAPLEFTIGCGTTMDIADRWILTTGGEYKRGHIAVGATETIGCAASGKIYAIATDDSTPNALLGLWSQEIVVNTDGSFAVGQKTIVDPVDPADIDPAWSAYNGAIGSFNVDQTDGNLLAVIVGNAAPTTKIVKFDANTGAVLWSTAIASDLPDFGGAARSIIRDGTFVWKGSTPIATNTYNVYTLDTLTGVVSTADDPVIGMSGATVWDGVNGWLVGHGAFTQATPGYPTVSPPVTFSDRYYRFHGVGGGGLTDYQAPAVFGYSYTSRGKVLRPILDAGAANGPAMGKTRRIHMYAILLQRSGPVKIGTEFDKLYPVPFKTPGGTPYAFGRLYSGIVQDTLESDYNFDGQIAWEFTRPVPGTVLAVTCFMHTQDR